MLSEWNSWSVRSDWCPASNVHHYADFGNKNERRDYFRVNNKELTLSEKLLLRLQAKVTPIVENTNKRKEHDDQQQYNNTCASQDLPDISNPTSSFLSRASTRAEAINWSELPSALRPSSHMNSARALRKEQQLQNMIHAVNVVLQAMKTNAKERGPSFSDISLQSPNSSSSAIPNPRPILVDFCCGSGHLGFPLAYLFPHCDVILLEHNATAIAKAHTRLAELQREASVHNVRIVHCGLQEFDEPFDVGVGIHACGWLSDIIQIKCFQRNAAFVLAPCCIGKVKMGAGFDITFKRDLSSHVSATSTQNVGSSSENSPPPLAGIDCQPGCAHSFSKSLHNLSLTVLSYPRSELFSTLLTSEEYYLLGAKSDYSDSEWNFNSAATKKGSLYKSYLEWDRLCAATDRHYEVCMWKMVPLECTPKNDVLLGVHQSKLKSIQFGCK